MQQKMECERSCGKGSGPFDVIEFAENMCYTCIRLQQ